MRFHPGGQEQWLEIGENRKMDGSSLFAQFSRNCISLRVKTETVTEG
jgi:hypothetical protein